MIAIKHGTGSDRRLYADQKIPRTLLFLDWPDARLADETRHRTAYSHSQSRALNVVGKTAAETIRADHWPVFLAIEHARRSINARKAQLGAPAGPMIESRAAE